MSFLAITKDLITDDTDKFVREEAKIFFSPLPQIPDTSYPILWLDLHISNEGYEICGKDKQQEFKQNGNSKISIHPGWSIRFKTKEKIGIANNITAIVMNSAGNAVKGLFIAPGKIDPGFRPNKLTLVVTNNSRRSIYLKSDDKIATIAFGFTSLNCAPTDSIGWADRRINYHYTDGLSERFKNRVLSIDFGKHIGEIILVIITVFITLVIQHYLSL